MIVVDSNVLAYLYLTGLDTEAAGRALQVAAEWLAPTLWRRACRDSLSGCMRHGSLTFEQALAIQHEAEALLNGAEHEPDSRRVLELVKASDCSAYDCEFIALAEALGVAAVTMDAKLIKAFPKIARSLTAA